MHLFTSILLLIIGARLFGELAHRLKQPSIVGEILAGIVLGPALLNYVHPTEQLSGISELSVFLIVLAAGLEMNIGDVANAIKGRGFVAAAADFVLPLLLGILVGVLFGYNLLQSTFLGLCLSITALPVAVRILEDFKLLDSSVARYSIATSIMNDIAALLFLGMLLDFSGPTSTFEGVSGFFQLLGGKFRNLLLLLGIIIGGSYLIHWGSQNNRIEKAVDRILFYFGKDALFGVVVLFVLVFGSLSENLGFHFIIGAFFASVMISREALGSTQYKKLEEVIQSISGGFLAPLFFGYLGLQFKFDAFTSPFFVLVVVGVAMGSKIWAGWLGARWLKMSKPEALGIGIILNGRGIMELVVANIGLQRGIIDDRMFSALVIMGVFTTVITPILFRKYVLADLTAPKTPSVG